MTGLEQPEGFPSRHPYSVLLPMGFTLPHLLTVERWALTPPFHPYPANEAVCFLRHYPWGFPRRALPGIAFHGARTFLTRGLSTLAHAAVRPAGRTQLREGRPKLQSLKRGSTHAIPCCLLAENALHLRAVGGRDRIHALGAMTGIVFQDRTACGLSTKVIGLGQIPHPPLNVGLGMIKAIHRAAITHTARRRRHDLHQTDLSVLAARLRIVIALYRYNRMREISRDPKLTGKPRHDILEFRAIRSSDGWSPAPGPATSPPSLLLLARLCRTPRFLVS